MGTITRIIVFSMALPALATHAANPPEPQPGNVWGGRGKIGWTAAPIPSHSDYVNGSANKTESCPPGAWDASAVYDQWTETLSIISMRNGECVGGMVVRSAAPASIPAGVTINAPTDPARYRIYMQRSTYTPRESEYGRVKIATAGKEIYHSTQSCALEAVSKLDFGTVTQGVGGDGYSRGALQLICERSTPIRLGLISLDGMGVRGSHATVQMGGGGMAATFEILDWTPTLQVPGHATDNQYRRASQQDRYSQVGWGYTPGRYWHW